MLFLQAWLAFFVNLIAFSKLWFLLIPDFNLILADSWPLIEIWEPAPTICVLTILIRSLGKPYCSNTLKRNSLLYFFGTTMSKYNCYLVRVNGVRKNRDKWRFIYIHESIGIYPNWKIEWVYGEIMVFESRMYLDVHIIFVLK